MGCASGAVRRESDVFAWRVSGRAKEGSARDVGLRSCAVDLMGRNFDVPHRLDRHGDAHDEECREEGEQMEQEPLMKVGYTASGRRAGRAERSHATLPPDGLGCARKSRRVKG